MPAPESFLVSQSGSLSSFLRRPGNVRFVRALIPAPSLTVGRCWSNDAFVGRSSVERESGLHI